MEWPITALRKPLFDKSEEAPRAQTLKELTRASYLAYQLRSEKLQMTRAARKQSKKDKKLTQMRRAAEDRALARELGCEVSDFA